MDLLTVFENWISKLIGLRVIWLTTLEVALGSYGDSAFFLRLNVGDGSTTVSR